VERKKWKKSVRKPNFFFEQKKHQKKKLGFLL
jgi:hypothetical protein